MAVVVAEAFRAAQVRIRVVSMGIQLREKGAAATGGLR